MYPLKELDFDIRLTGFDDIVDEEQEKGGEVEFTETLGETHNYLVLYFDNDVDWLQATTLFDVKKVKEYSTRKDGKEPKKPSVGIGRVLNGAKALNKILGGGFNEN